MSSVFDDLIRYYARKMGKAHVKQALKDLRSGVAFDPRAYEQAAKRSWWNDNSIHCVFDSAYNGPWYDLGANDALKGARRFDTPAYLQGWRNKIVSLSFEGWMNPHIIQRYGWIDETIGGNYITAKHHMDQLDWQSAPYDKKTRVGG